MKKAFIDANIILDFLDAQRNRHRCAYKVFEKLIDEDYLFVVTEDILTTVYYVIKNKSAVLKFFEQVLSEWELVSFGTELLRRSVTICLKEQSLDFEDVCQALAADKVECDIIISNDKDFYRIDTIKVYSTEVFLNTENI